MQITKSGWGGIRVDAPTPPHTLQPASIPFKFDNKVWLDGTRVDLPPKKNSSHTHTITASFHTFDNKVWLGGTRTDAIIVVFTRHPGVGQLHWLFKKEANSFQHYIIHCTRRPLRLTNSLLKGNHQTNRINRARNEAACTTKKNNSNTN